jgi:uncharacterized membrane protein
MPFCSKCGNPLQPSDQFCKQCGTPQPTATRPGASSTAQNDPLVGLEPHIASALCYLPFIGWIMCIYVLAMQRFRTDYLARFHAFQALFTFIVYLIFNWVIEGVLFSIMDRPWYLVGTIRPVFILGWIFMVYRTSLRQTIRIPVLADLADKSVNEQR